MKWETNILDSLYVTESLFHSLGSRELAFQLRLQYKRSVLIFKWKHGEKMYIFIECPIL